MFDLFYVEILRCAYGVLYCCAWHRLPTGSFDKKIWVLWVFGMSKYGCFMGIFVILLKNMGVLWVFCPLEILIVSSSASLEAKLNTSQLSLEWWGCLVPLPPIKLHRNTLFWPFYDLDFYELFRSFWLRVLIFKHNFC